MTNRRSSQKAVGVRLLYAVDNYLRKKQRRKGDLSRLISEAIRAVDLRDVPLTLFHGKREKVLAKVTQVVIPQDMCDDIEKWAAVRRCTMNELLNSALSMGLPLNTHVRIDDRTGSHSSMDWDTLNPPGRKHFFDELLALKGREAGPDLRSSAGSFYKFDPQLENTVEVGSDGTRYLVGCVNGAGDLVRLRKAGRDAAPRSK